MADPAFKFYDFNPFYNFLAGIGYPHPIHPTEVHMPIGLIVGAVVLIYVALIFNSGREEFRRNRRLRLGQAVKYCILLSFIWVFPTMIFGFMDWQHFYQGAWTFPIKVKVITAPVLALFLAIALFVGRRKGPFYAAPLYTVCFILVVVLGYYGGQMVYGGAGKPVSSSYTEGEKIFAADCSACHPKGGNSIMRNLPIIGSSKLADFDTFLSYVRDPKLPDGKPGPMPAWPASKLSDEQSKQVYEYIVHALAKGGPIQ